jgi:hypothetical protein
LSEKSGTQNVGISLCFSGEVRGKLRVAGCDSLLRGELFRIFIFLKNKKFGMILVNAKIFME